MITFSDVEESISSWEGEIGYLEASKPNELVNTLESMITEMEDVIMKLGETKVLDYFRQ